jgi:hypothetical protein
MVTFGIASLFFQDLVLATEGSGDLISISSTLSSQVQAVAQLLIIISYVAGVGFALAGIIQFKAHKDNPTQVPLSKPIVYLIVGACLLFLPTMISSAGQSIFGSTKQSSGNFQGVIQ